MTTPSLIDSNFHSKYSDVHVSSEEKIAKRGKGGRKVEAHAQWLLLSQTGRSAASRNLDVLVEVERSSD